MRTNRFAVAALLAASIACADDEIIVHDTIGRDLDRAVQVATGGGFWGTIAVARGDEVLLAKGYGFADYQGRPNTALSLLEIASASKQFTAAGVLKLQMLGKLDVHDPLGAILGRVPADKAPITVHQLLTHTSGISPSIGLPYSTTASRDELIDYVLAQPLDAAPGSRHAYCNVAYALLAAIVEIASGEPFETFMEREVFSPAGLADTGFIGDADLDAGRATWRLSPREPMPTATDWHWSWGYRGMGGVVTTVHDLVRWHRALLGDAVLDAAAKQILYEPALEGYACGWKVNVSDHGTTRVSHGGRVEGYGCQYVRDLDEDVVIAILSNGRSDVFAAQRAIEDVLFPRPTVTVSLDVVRCELDEFRAVRVESEAWRVRRVDDWVELVLVHGGDGEPMATISAPPGIAKRITVELQGMLARRKDADAAVAAVAAVASMDAGVYFAGLGGRNQAITLRGVELTVIPQYVGMGEDGQRVIDDRITFIVQDRERGFWPVMTKMNVAAARALLEALRAALE